MEHSFKLVYNTAREIAKVNILCQKKSKTDFDCLILCNSRSVPRLYSCSLNFALVQTSRHQSIQSGCGKRKAKTAKYSTSGSKHLSETVFFWTPIDIR